MRHFVADAPANRILSRILAIVPNCGCDIWYIIAYHIILNLCAILACISHLAFISIITFVKIVQYVDRMCER